MATEHSHSAACCTTPVAQVGEYTIKGRWILFNGRKTYVSGPATAAKAVVMIYDIFGFTPQSLQGADILASQGSEPYLVIMPDFFDGRAAQTAWLAPDADKAALAAHIAFVTSTELRNKVFAVVRELQAAPEEAYSITAATAAAADSSSAPLPRRWAAVGFCWGAKMASLMAAAAADDTGRSIFFDVVALTSPSRIDPDEAVRITVPTVLLASRDEDPALVARYADNLVGAPKHVETFQQVHGWMSARAELDQDEPRAEYERGYKIMLDFMGKHL